MSAHFTPGELRELLDAATEAVLASGALIREHWSRPRNISHKKSPKDLVTETDLAVEALLKQSLGRILPEAGFLGEEGGELPGEDGGANGLSWVVDPVDGTTNFAHAIPFVATSVALCHRGRPVLGLVNLPVLGELFVAARGQGAAMNGQPIRVSATATLLEAVLATGFPYDIAPHLGRILRQLELAMPATQGVRRPGAAALDLAYVACGRFDAFFEFALNPWDTAAGILLVEEAGGRVGRMLGEAPYVPGAPDILVSNGLLHDQMQELLNRAARDA